MPQAHLTDRSVKTLKPQGVQTMYFDAGSGIPGFGIRVSASTKTFCLVIGRQRQRQTIGRYPTISLADARQEAKRILAERTLGNHRLPTISFEGAYDVFKKLHCSQKAPRTSEDYQYVLDRHFLPKLKLDRLHDITPHVLASITDKLIDRPGEHSHALAVARTFFRFCVRRRYLKHSPLEGIQIPKSIARDHILSDDEIKKVWKSADELGWPFGPLIQLALSTGARRGEIVALRRSWIDTTEKTITFPREAMKGKKPHIIPYSDLTGEILEALPDHGDLLFPARGKDDKSMSGFSKFKKELDKKLSGVEPFTIHDCRRTFASSLQRLGVPIHVTEKLLAHTSGSLGGIVAVYQRHDLMPEMREAVNKWNANLLSIVSR